MDEFCLINKHKNRLKRFKTFGSIFHQTRGFMEIEYACLYQKSNMPVVVGSRIETIDAAREEYKKLISEGWRKTNIFNHNFFN